MQMQGQRVPGEGNSKCKDCKAGKVMAHLRNRRKPGWPKHDDQEGEWQDVKSGTSRDQILEDWNLDFIVIVVRSHGKILSKEET